MIIMMIDNDGDNINNDDDDDLGDQGNDNDD